MSAPIRTCVGCRKRTDKDQLLRVVQATEGLLPDPRQVEPGRGAYLHHDQACLELALKRKALNRALRLTGGGPDLTAVSAVLGAAMLPGE